MHHAFNGCTLNVGDLLGSGTISGPDNITRQPAGNRWNGTEPVELAGGIRRNSSKTATAWLRGWCQGDGYRVGFGEVEGTILPAV